MQRYALRRIDAAYSGMTSMQKEGTIYVALSKNGESRHVQIG